MAVIKKGNFAKIKQDARTAIGNSIEAFTWELHNQVKQATPVDTGLLKSRWQRDFNGPGLLGVVGNTDPKASAVAEGPSHRRPTRAEKRNIGFHIKGIDQAVKKLNFIVRRNFRAIFR